MISKSTEAPIELIRASVTLHGNGGAKLYAPKPERLGRIVPEDLGARGAGDFVVAADRADGFVGEFVDGVAVRMGQFSPIGARSNRSIAVFDGL